MKQMVLKNKENYDNLGNQNSPTKTMLSNIEDLPYYHLLLKEDLQTIISHNSSFALFGNDFNWIENSRKISEVFSQIPASHFYNNPKRSRSELNVNNLKDHKKINKNLVHKNKEENVIISDPIKLGNIYYSYMFPEIEEFQFDHDSDHIQGMLLMETCRQAGLATVHLNGLSTEGKMNLTKMYTDFNNYVETNEPVLIRSISNPIIFPENKKTVDIFCMVNLIQFGKICATTTFSSIAFNTKENIDSFRNKSYSINQRKKSKHLSQLNKYV